MHILIIGLGLIGGSLGLALKKASWRKAEITGYVRRPEIGNFALNIGAVDRISSNLEDEVGKSDLIIISTPVLTVKDIFIRIAPLLPDTCIVTDTASTKQQIMKWAGEIFPANVSFIGGHPMAGKDESGIQYADAELFLNSAYCITSETETKQVAEDMLTDMISTIGANVMKIDAQEHDNLVAGISHLPILISVALVDATTKSPMWPTMARLAASGFRDLTRLASGDPRMSRDICLTNREPIIRGVVSRPNIKQPDKIPNSFTALNITFNCMIKTRR